MQTPENPAQSLPNGQVTEKKSPVKEPTNFLHPQKNKAAKTRRTKSKGLKTATI